MLLPFTQTPDCTFLLIVSLCCPAVVRGNLYRAPPVEHTFAFSECGWGSGGREFRFFLIVRGQL